MRSNVRDDGGRSPKDVLEGKRGHDTTKRGELPTSFSVALALPGRAVSHVSLDLDDKGEGSEIEVDTHNRLAGAAMNNLARRSRQPILTTKHKESTFQAIGAARVDQDRIKHRHAMQPGVAKNLKPLPEERRAACTKPKGAVDGILRFLATARLGEIDDGASWAGTRPHLIHLGSIDKQQARG